MTFDTFVKHVHLARRRAAIVNQSLEAALLVCGTGVVVGSVGLISRVGAAVMLVAGVAVFCVILIKRRWLSLPRFEDTCSLIDDKLNLKNRATSLFYARRESTVIHRSICPVIENQLASIPLPDLRSSPLGEPISWRKVQLFAATLALLGAIAAFRKPTAVNVESGLAADKLEEFLAENPQLPEEAIEQLESLADTIRSEGLGSEVVEEQIATTLATLDGIEEGAVAASAKKGEEAERSGNSSPVATPTPTPTPTPKSSRGATTLDDKTDVQHGQKSASEPDKEKSSAKQQKSADVSSSGEKSKSDDKSDSQSGSENKDSSSAGASLDEKKKDAKDSSGGEGGKDTKSNQSGGKDGSSEGAGSKGDTSSSPGGGNKGAQQKGQQGAAGEGQAGGQEGEGDQAGSQGSVGQRGQASQQRGGTQQGAGGEGDSQAEGKTTQQGAGEGQPTAALQEARDKVAGLSKNQDTQAEVSGDKGAAQSSKSTDSPSEKKGGKQGDAKQSKGSSEEEKPKSPGKGGKKGNDAEKQSTNDASNAGNGDGEFTNNPAGQSASLGERSAEKMLMEGKEGGLSGPKGFKDSVVEEKGLEKVNPTFGRETGKVSEHSNPAEFKRSLKKIPLAQPDAVISRADQPIPLEYRGVLGSD